MPTPKAKARLFVDCELAEGRKVSLPRAQSHYVGRVMRLGIGDAVTVFNGRDGEWGTAISAAGRNEIELTCELQRRPQEPEPDIWLVFAPLKKTRIDFVVEKATELGVSRLVPVITERTAVTRVNIERLTAQTIEAAEQCERLSLPEIAEPVALPALLAGWPAGRRLLVMDETRMGKSIAAALEETPPAVADAILIGPEGGFAASELDALRKLPFVTTVAAGPRILRAETAAVAALSCWQALAGDWK